MLIYSDEDHDICPYCGKDLNKEYKDALQKGNNVLSRKRPHTCKAKENVINIDVKLNKNS